MTRWIREFARAAFSALVAAAPGAIGTRVFAGDNMAFALSCAASVLMFFVVLLVNYYGLGLSAAFGHVLAEYWQATFGKLTGLGEAVDVRPRRYRWDNRWEKRARNIDAPELTSAEERYNSIITYIGAAAGGIAGLALTVAVCDAQPQVGLVQWGKRILLGISLASVGAGFGAFASGAYLLACMSPANRRFVVGSGAYGAAFGFLLLSSLDERSPWYPVGSSIAFTLIGLFTAVVGIVVAEAKGYYVR